MFLEPSDFTDFYKVSGDTHAKAELQLYIDRYEPHYLKMLLGIDLYNLFIADLDVNNVPQSPIYQAIYKAFSFDYYSQIVVSDGMIEMLKGFVYYNYTRDSDFNNTAVGNFKKRFSNSDAVNVYEFGINERFNKALVNFENIQWYIEENITSYPDYNGQKIEFKHWL